MDFHCFYFFKSVSAAAASEGASEKDFLYHQIKQKKMPKQTFYYYDYLGPLAVALIFALVLLILSFFLLNFLLVSKHDELTVFERFGSRHNLRLGPHRLDSIRRINEHKAALEAAEREGLENKHGQCPIITIPKVNVDAPSTAPSIS